MLAAILQAAGYKTGLYTSPHLLDFRERIKTNGRMIPEKYIIKFVKQYKSDFEKIEPSFFEWTVGLAFDYFRKQKVEIAIIETGLGGRLDSTNVINPILSIITNIGYDHTQFLGNTLKEIAREKAGIIKHKVPVIIGEKHKETVGVFVNVAKKSKSPLFFAEDKVRVDSFKRLNRKALMRVTSENYIGNVQCDLTGYYQKKNIRNVLLAIEILNVSGFKITNKNICEGLKGTKQKTGLRGRWEQISSSPKVIADTAHNPQGAQELVLNLKSETYNKLHFILGMVGDKDISAVLKHLPKKAAYYFCKPDLPRGLPSSELKLAAEKFKLKGVDCGSVLNAIKEAQKATMKNDLILISGSTFTVADSMKFYC
jgi:dihydrofolate synthase/folylpolyglutamate synthase